MSSQNPSPLKGKTNIMYEDEYDPPCWVYHKDECDCSREGDKLFTHKIFMKDDIRSAVEYLKKEACDVCKYTAIKNKSILKCKCPLMKVIDEAFEDVMKEANP